MTAKDIVIYVQLATNIATADKEISGSIKPFQGYMLKDLDEQGESHYQDRDESCGEDPLSKDLLVGAGAPASTGSRHGWERKESRPVRKVVGRKRKGDGMLVGSCHPDSRLDTRKYEVEFNYGAREAYVYNTIAQSL
jgi:hypothetical protein